MSKGHGQWDAGPPGKGKEGCQINLYPQDIHAVSIRNSCAAASFFFFLINLFYFWLCWVFVAARELSPAAANGGPLFVAVRGLLIVVASLAAEHGL